MPRKRARGAGRKPKGEFAGKTSTFSTRITAETRRALDDGARRKNRSLSQHVERLLHDALQKPLGQPHTRALAHVVALLAERIEEDAGKRWTEDPFTGMALLHAMEALLRRLIRVEETTPTIPAAVLQASARWPRTFGAELSRPTGFGHMQALQLISAIEAAASQGDNDEKTRPIFLSADPAALGQVGRDLGFSKRKKGKSA